MPKILTVRHFAATTLVAATVAIFSSFHSSAALADTTTQGFQISPPVTTLALDPGTGTRQTIKVTNLTSSQLTLAVGKENFAAKGEEGEVELTDSADPRYSLAPYFSISQPTLVVPPQGTSTVSYVLSVPANAEPGGRYGSITFTTVSNGLAAGQSGATVRQNIAALVFLRINGAANEQLKIASFAPSKTFGEYGPVTFTTRVSNAGNVHEKPTGTIVVKDIFGLTTATLPLAQHYVIPGAIRRLTTQLDHHLLFGRYTATLTLHNGTIQTLTAKTAFTVIPYKIVLGVVIALIIIIFIFRRGRRRFGRAFRILAGRE